MIEERGIRDDDSDNDIYNDKYEYDQVPKATDTELAAEEAGEVKDQEVVL